MREQFPEFYRLSDEDFGKLWREATFVVDTNVLLHLYRYPQPARDDLIAALTNVASRLWLPYHVALEFHRKRPSVMAEQRRRFGEIRTALNKVVSSLSELEDLAKNTVFVANDIVASLKASVETNLGELKKIEDAAISNSNSDNLLPQIDGLFNGKIGARPSQEMLEDVYRQGESRFQFKTPPGFADDKKDEDYSHDGLKYKAKYGDLIIWLQTIEYAKTLTEPAIILLTDDKKSDWWWTINGQTIGPLPELKAEMRREGKATAFHMYNSKQFLEFSKKFLGSQTSDQSINVIGEVLREISDPPSYRTAEVVMNKSVLIWLKAKYPDYTESLIRNNAGRASVVLRKDNVFVGVVILKVKGTADAIRGIAKYFIDASKVGHFDGHEKLEFVIVMDGGGDLFPLYSAISDLKLPEGVNLTLGQLASGGALGATFIPVITAGQERTLGDTFDLLDSTPGS